MGVGNRLSMFVVWLNALNISKNINMRTYIGMQGVDRLTN